MSRLQFPCALLLLIVLTAGAAAIPLVSLSAASISPGTIAYVRPDNATGDEIRLIEPDGSNDRLIWSIGQADPYNAEAITGLDWRPDARELAFSSDHEGSCSWFASDIYAVRYNGGGYRRVTNAPKCADLANYPQGDVTVTIHNDNVGTTLYQIYVAGAPGRKSINVSPGSSASMIFTNVADFGSQVVQPIVAINGLFRWSGGAVADVQPGQTVDAGTLVISGRGMELVAAYRPGWRSDGSQIGYTSGCSHMYGIAAIPPAGAIGQTLLNQVDAQACMMDWGPLAKADQLLYATLSAYERHAGILLAIEGSNMRGDLLVPLTSYSSEAVKAVQWLPDGSGFLFVRVYMALGIFTDIFRYDLATNNVTQLTYFGEEQFIGDLSISPDGRFVVFEHAAMQGIPTDILIMQQDGSNIRLLVPSAAHPSWSPRALPPPTPRSYLPFVRR